MVLGNKLNVIRPTPTENNAHLFSISVYCNTMGNGSVLKLSHTLVYHILSITTKTTTDGSSVKSQVIAYMLSIFCFSKQMSTTE